MNPPDARLRTQPLHPQFGARVDGLDLRAPLGDAVVEALKEALDRHGVLVFAQQHLDAAQQVRFSALFGPLEKAITRQDDTGAGVHVANLSNVDHAGALVRPNHRTQLFHAANQLWHTDSSFKPRTALASLLSAHQVPTRGGETEFVSTRTAYAALPAQRRAMLEGLWAVHDFQRSRDLVAPGLVDRQVQDMLPLVARPLVRRNPRSGEPALYLASHAVCIEGMSVTDSRMLLDELLDWCTRPDWVYTHRWKVGDLVMWDNRATMHRGRPWDAQRERRVMARTTVMDMHYEHEPEVRGRAA